MLSIRLAEKHAAINRNHRIPKEPQQMVMLVSSLCAFDSTLVKPACLFPLFSQAISFSLAITLHQAGSRKTPTARKGSLLKHASSRCLKETDILKTWSFPENVSGQRRL